MTTLTCNAERWLISAALLAATAGRAEAQSADATLAADADTTIKELSPSANFGGDTKLRTQGLPRERTLVRINQATLAAAAAGRPVLSASLELTTQQVAWIWGNVSVHRVSKAWTEAGATWTCASDSAPGNTRNDCTSANAWSMSSGGGYVSPASDTERVSNGASVVKFDVTADVQAFLSGAQTNNGWLVKVAIEGVPGSVTFRSRESGIAPRLVLDLADVAVPGPVGAPCTSDAECGGYANAVCFTEEALAIPGGYCSAFCATDSECPSNTACVQGACALPCIDGGCSPGYFCLDTGSAQACLPTCTSDADCSGGRVCAPLINECRPPE
jgi:hypothetical protein